MGAQKSPTEMTTADNQVTTTEMHDNVEGKNSVDSTMDKTKTTTTTDSPMDMDLDEGELSDASSASTIPLDEDDRDWTLRTRQPAPPAPTPPASKQLTDQPNTATISTSQQPVIGNDEPSENTTPSMDTVPTASMPHQEAAPVEEEKSITPTKPSPEEDEQVKLDQQQQPSETTKPGDMNDDGKEVHQEGSDQAKPTKVKVSLQEYLSRRMASKDTPKSEGSQSLGQQ
jgi:hypothetical protein